MKPANIILAIGSGAYIIEYQIVAAVHFIFAAGGHRYSAVDLVHPAAGAAAVLFIQVVDPHHIDTVGSALGG